MAGSGTASSHVPEGATQPLPPQEAQLRDALLAEISAATTQEAWESVRVGIFGKSGRFRALQQGLGKLPPEERRDRGQVLNGLKKTLEGALESRRQELARQALAQRLEREREDISVPVELPPPGRIHPINQAIAEIVSLFAVQGFDVAEGPDIESQWHNFAALNTPDHHPARTEQDTFYLPGGKGEVEGEERLVLRTQTSGVQIRTMLDGQPPLRIIAPGRTYRADHDATHSPMFHQCEGLMIDRKGTLTLAHLKGVLTDFLRRYFGQPDLPVRFRASYFPFTVPSMEIDIGWSKQKGTIGAGEDWLEVLGAGMVQPRVLANCGLDPAVWQGFAFGMGVERLAMLKNGIADLRAFYDSDLRWLRHYGAAPMDSGLASALVEGA
ncbi:phenylalanine--tRNA ligase subunit alpha [Formicincola oecophyllae]|uniref:Phenylalanine--tRNA ligase alpha subunit n=1 Tax=Formicincola oecophyllae TaxID=2558361 RepID=A0A4Y6U9P4_9PROT|nr:phenylalanine--tRNA ligase subunit alpha [Formicincola oecophyllae]QDH13081.1 phenylalanine--tRNA ligase subunit alpha [Formicincola oecophyllae]